MTAKDFYRVAGKQVNELTKPYGFKKNGRFFYRITKEGVVQQFCLLWLYGSFTVRFHLTNVYSCDWRDRRTEGEEIYQLINGSNQWLSRSYPGYEMDAEEWYGYAGNLCAKSVENIILPFFEAHKDLSSARNYVVEHNIRIKMGLAKFDISELGFNLGMSNFSVAQEILEYYIQNASGFHQKWWNEAEQEYTCLLEALRTNNMEYVAAYMNRKRDAAYEQYKWKNKKTEA